jgi:hypothetical protein
MPLVNIQDVQNWLSDNRLLVDVTDDLDDIAGFEEHIKAQLSTLYDTTLWTDASSTPVLVRSVLGARLAALRYRKVYADQADELPHADWLEAWATSTVEGILNGTLPLTDATDVETASAQSSISFYPDDTTEVTYPEQARKFTMGQVF